MEKNFFQLKNWLDHALTHNVDAIIGEKKLRAELSAKKKLRIKFGVDVTHPLIHIGHGVNFWKMREFQEQGHKVIFLIGDFTSRIGDPTGKSKTRVERTAKEIEHDAKEYISQASKILLNSPDVFEVRKNSEWYSSMSVSEFFLLCGKVTHGRLIQRDMFQRRIEEGQEIYMHEMLYPILQGYDSYKLQADVTVIGTDQLFNELMGRHYQEVFHQKPQSIITTVITPGIDGKEKQSKSLGNFIAITDSPGDKYGKIMTIPDNLIMTYYRVYTFVDQKTLDVYEHALQKGENPRNIKMHLAKDLVALYHGQEEAGKTEKEFIAVFQKKEIPGDIAEANVAEPVFIVDFLLRFHKTASKSAARRLIEGGGVKIGDEVVGEDRKIEKRDHGKVVKVGKRHFYKIIYT